MDIVSDPFLTIVIATIVLLLLLATIISLLFIYQSRQIRNQVELKRVKDEYAHEILKTKLEIQEQTLHYISQEIHDNVGQVLSLANLSLSSIKWPMQNPVKETVLTAMELIQKSIDDLRSLSKKLDPEGMLTGGLVTSLQFALDQLKGTGVYSTQLSVQGTERPIDPPRKLLVYRIVQEALNNIIRHAKASIITMSLSFDDQYVTIYLQDNGIGFEVRNVDSSSASRRGVGLANMKNRAELMHGNMQIDSVIGGGTTLRLRIPAN